MNFRYIIVIYFCTDSYNWKRFISINFINILKLRKLSFFTADMGARYRYLILRAVIAQSV
jgi:hypothetical protein